MMGGSRRNFGNWFSFGGKEKKGRIRLNWHLSRRIILKLIFKKWEGCGTGLGLVAGSEHGGWCFYWLNFCHVVKSCCECECECVSVMSLCCSRWRLNAVSSVAIERRSPHSSCKSWSRCSRRRITLTCSSAKKLRCGSICRRPGFR